MKTIIITGAASGLGRAVAKEFDKGKCRLLLCDRNEIAAGEYKNEVHKLKVDLRSEDDIRLIFLEAKNRFRKIDVVINNAGITSKKPFYDFSPEEIDSIMSVNARAAMITTIEAYKHMNSGVIVTTSSLAGWFSPKDYSVYAASKHAIDGFMKSAAKDMDKQIRLLVFHPFRLDTNLNKDSKIKSPAKHRLDPRLYAQYIVARINGNTLLASYFFLRNHLLWLFKIIFPIA